MDKRVRELVFLIGEWFIRRLGVKLGGSEFRRKWRYGGISELAWVGR